MIRHNIAKALSALRARISKAGTACDLRANAATAAGKPRTARAWIHLANRLDDINWHVVVRLRRPFLKAKP